MRSILSFLLLICFLIIIDSSVLAKDIKQKAFKSIKEPVTGIEFVRVKGGCFQMGCGKWTDDCQPDELPVHKVCLDTFWIGKYEVTQEQWLKVTGMNPSYNKVGGNYPVEGVSWLDVQEFIGKLNSSSKDAKFRLPTEAEWEFAARSGGKAEKYAGGNSPDIGLWNKHKKPSDTFPVGKAKPNGLGLYDMSGNVWEWVSDWYSKDYYSQSPKKTPTGPSTGKKRVLRGDARYNPAKPNMRAADRWFYKPDRECYDAGLRLVLSIPADK
jgi:formylglycine-generating enzyme required for sulfatase activity